MGAKRSRDEKKDQAAARRRVQQEKDRRERRWVFGIGGTVALLIIAVVPITNWYNAHQRGKTHAIGYVKKASTAAKAAGCTGVRNDREMPTSIVKAGTTVDYAKLAAAAGNVPPPSSGPQEVNPLPATPTFYALANAPRPERAVGNLNHGFVVVWYDSQLPAAQVKTLQAQSSTNPRTLIVPWTRSVFPDGQHVVFTAWDRTQRCKTVSAAALTEFATTYVDAPLSGRGWASPSAPTPNGAAGTGPKASPSATPSPSVSPGASATPSASASAIVPSPTPASSATVPKVTATPTP